MNQFIGAGAKRLHGIMLKQAVLVAVSTLMLILMISLVRNPLFADNDFSSLKGARRSLKEVPSVIKEYALLQQDVSDEIYQLEKEVRKEWDCEPQLENGDLSAHQFPTSTDHPHSVVAMISCTQVHYRCAINGTWNFGRIVFGVLSSSKERRDAIRSTWAKGIMPSASVFFVVAGPWENSEEEYNTHHDMIWVDQEDLYTSPTPGGLTMKTNAFLLVAYNQIMKYRQNTEYFIKADDDSYFDTDRLYAAIQQAGQNGPVDFGGNCYSKVKPFRNHERGWQSYEDYPFNYFPPLCWGGIGYVMSPKFMQCAVGEGHIERLRYLSIEDGSTGLLAERCGMPPKSFYGNRFQVYKFHWKDYDKKELMKGLIVQHDLKTEEEIYSMHDSMQHLAQNSTLG